MARFDKTDQSIDIISLLLATTIIILIINFVHDLLNVMA